MTTICSFGVWSLHAVFLPCIYDGSFVDEIGMKYAKTVLCKADFSFLWSRNVLSACFCAQLLHVMQMSFEALLSYLENRLISNMNPKSKVYLNV